MKKENYLKLIKAHQLLIKRYRRRISENSIGEIRKHGKCPLCESTRQMSGSIDCSYCSYRIFHKKRCSNFWQQIYNHAPAYFIPMTIDHMKIRISVHQDFIKKLNVLIKNLY